MLIGQIIISTIHCPKCNGLTRSTQTSASQPATVSASCYFLWPSLERNLWVDLQSTDRIYVNTSVVICYCVRILLLSAALT
jgi:hypothetical protein